MYSELIAIYRTLFIACHVLCTMCYVIISDNNDDNNDNNENGNV
jgi:hypothetical protein